MRLIDADELINEFDRTFLGNNPRGVIRATIENAPTIEPDREKGKWIRMSDADGEFYACSECGCWIGEPTNFCSECGADMRERSEDAEIH